MALLSVTAKAQNGRLSLGVEVAAPIGDFADQSNVGVGGTLRFEQPLNDKLSLTGTAGLISFGGDEISSGVPYYNEYRRKTTSTMIPIQIGLKYYTQKMMDGFYVALETGVHVSSFKVSSETIVNGYSSTSDNTKTSSDFGLAPELGFHLANLDFGIRYQMIFVKATVTSTNPVTQQTTTSEKNTTYSYIGLRLAYVFGSK